MEMPKVHRRGGPVIIVAVLGLVILVAGCGGATPASAPGSSSGAGTTAQESNPPGDIPDNQVFVPYAPDSGEFTVSVPEGWARSTEGDAVIDAVIFTDKLNSVRIETVLTATAPDVAAATAAEVPLIARTTTGYTPGEVSMVSRTAGEAVLITYGADSAPDPVTGKTFTDAVERYEFFKDGVEVVLTLSGPQGADNVDPWKTITDSFGWTP